MKPVRILLLSAACTVAVAMCLLTVMYQANLVSPDHICYRVVRHIAHAPIYACALVWEVSKYVGRTARWMASIAVDVLVDSLAALGRLVIDVVRSVIRCAEVTLDAVFAWLAIWVPHAIREIGRFLSYIGRAVQPIVDQLALVAHDLWSRFDECCATIRWLASIAWYYICLVCSAVWLECCSVWVAACDAVCAGWAAACIAWADACITVHVAWVEACSAFATARARFATAHIDEL